MSLPEESVAANTLPEVTTIPIGKKLIFTDPDTNEGGIITLENLSKQILQNLTSQTFALDQGNLTLLQALNQLNSKTFKGSISLISYDNNDESYVTAVFSINPSQTCNPCAINIANRVCVFFLNGYIPKLLGFSMTSNVRECFFSGNGVTNITLTIKFGKDNYLSEDQCKTATVMSYIIK